MWGNGPKMGKIPKFFTLSPTFFWGKLGKNPTFDPLLSGANWRFCSKTVEIYTFILPF